MKLGSLEFSPVEDNLELVAAPTAELIQKANFSSILVAEINPDLSDTTIFCEHYGIGLDVTANCVVLEAKRADRAWYAACIVLGTTRADVNGVVRRHLSARKVSFASMETATSKTNMEYGGITPVGLPADWPILVDSKVAKTHWVLIGSGIRKSKLLIPGELFPVLPNVEVTEIAQ